VISLQALLSKIQRIKNIPDKIILIGFIISCALLVKAMIVSSAQFSYDNFILCEFLYQNSIFIFIECTIAAILFRYLENTKKDEN